jgi:hypothetical protein
MCDSPAAGADGNQKRLELISKYLGRQPGCIHQPEIVNTAQFHFETLKQFLRGVVQLRVAELHVKPLAREFDRAAPSINSEQEQVAPIQDPHQYETS